MMIYNNGLGSTATAYPYLSVSTSITDNVYAGSPLFNGVFSGQVANIVGYYPDQMKLNFQCTQSLLNASGRIYCGVFY